MRARTPFIGLLATLILLSFSPPLRGAGSRNETAIDTLQLSLDLERKARAEEIDELERTTTRLGRAENGASVARGRLIQLLRDRESDSGSLEAADEAVADAEARVQAVSTRRHAQAQRLLDRTRRIILLNDEIAKRRTATRGVSDPISGRWDVVINPGSRRGSYRLSLDGTLVSGDYTLDGNSRGSLRGTYVGDKLTLQRIDSERGMDANFYGRVTPSQKKVVGTWEATAIAPAIGPSAGTWGGNLMPDREENDGEQRQ
ncbi:MAG: hypothetical protein ABIT01_00920 [Thermoanaerobaculia bacterium]